MRLWLVTTSHVVVVFRDLVLGSRVIITPSTTQLCSLREEPRASHLFWSSKMSLPPDTDLDSALVPLGFGELTVSPGDHIGHFYDDREECLKILAPFIQTGLAAGDKCVCISTKPSRAELASTLSANGVDVDAAVASGQLVLSDGWSEPEQLKAMLAGALAEIGEQYPLLRWVGEMTWCHDQMPTSENMMEFESHSNLIERPPAVFLCQYQLKSFLGSVVMDALKTHPLCIVNSSIYQNPYYMDPQVYLEEFRHRGPTPLSA